MPIRLNLLAEAQAAEDLRRRDPVKRVLWLAGLVIALMLAWSSFLQLRVTLASSEVTGIEAQMGVHTNEFRKVLDNQKKAVEIDNKLRVLRQLAASRFLNGTLLNAFQQTSVEDVQLIRLRVGQLYNAVEGTKTRTNDDNVVIKGRPPATTEKIVLNVEGMDLSSGAGDQVNRFRDTLLRQDFFKSNLNLTNGVRLSHLDAPQTSPEGKPSVQFSFECHFLERDR